MNKGLKLSSYARYDEACDRDYMVYEASYSNGFKDYVSREVFRHLKALAIINDEFKISFQDKEQTITFASVEEPYPHIRFSVTRKIKDKDKYDLLKEVLS